MKLSELIKLGNCRVISGDENVEIKGVTADSNSVRHGYAFVAVKGRNIDGHDFVADAVKQGASAVVVSDPVKVSGCTVVATSDTRKAFSVISAAFYAYPQSELITVGITGTNGKTTVASMLRHILNTCGKPCGMTGTVENSFGRISEKTGYTTPEPDTLFALMRRGLDEGCTHFVCEVSSQALDQSRIYGIDFNLGIFTNISEDHLDWHGSMRQYVEAKQKLFDSSRMHLVNEDNEYSGFFLGYPNTMTFSIKKKADFYAENISTDIKSNSFTFVCGGERYPTIQKLRGMFNVSNSVAAMSAAVMLGVKPVDAVRAAETFEGVKGRFEFVETDNDFNVIIDYAHTPDGLEKLLQSVERIRKPCGRIILVFGCGGDRDRQKRPIMGRIASTMADFTVVTSDNPRTEAPDLIITDILRGINSAGTVVVSDRKKAIEYALCAARKNDIVVIAGKGHETYMTVGAEKIPFDEREIIKDILSGIGRH